MKRNYLYVFAFSALAFYSCDDMLDPKVDGGYGEEFAWKNPDKAKGFLLQAYDVIPKRWDSDYSNTFLDAATDNAVAGDPESSMYKLAHGGISNSTNPIGIWDKAYKQFYNINLFLEKGLTDDIIYKLSDEEINKEFKRRLKGVAFFLRAWWGNELLRVYGGISDDGEALGYHIVTSSIQGQDENLQYERDSYEDCVEQILADCDSALQYLPEKLLGNTNEAIYKEVNIGSIDKRVCWALKSRVSLYAASPAYQPQGSYAIGEDSIQKKWMRAARISCEALAAKTQDGKDLIGGYTNGGLGEDKFNKNTSPDEFMFRKYYNNQSIEKSNYPPMFRGNARTQPSQNLVDAFYDINGYPIDHPKTVYDPAKPYENRDPRLNWTVYYDGRVFDGRPLEIYINGENGLPAQDAPGYDYRNTRTGYYLRKWLSTKSNMLSLDNSQNDNHLHALIRRAEVYLNCAEALNEAVGPKGTLPEYTNRVAYNIINNIRKQAGIATPGAYLDEIAPLGKEEFRKVIQNERRIELAFENHRYFDMRRWLLPLDEPIKGMECIKNGDTKEYNTNIIVEQRDCFNDEKFYYSPLPYDELVKNPLMKDNKGWSKR